MSHPILDSQRAKIAALEGEPAIARAMLTGMEMMVEISASRPTKLSYVGRTLPTSSRRAPSGNGGGKVPGQLSMAWRQTLEEFFRSSLTFTEKEAAFAYMQITGKGMRARDVRRRLEGYAKEHQFVETEPDGRFRVTEVAAERFGFARTPKGGRMIDFGESHNTTPPLFGDREGGEALSNPNNLTS